MNGDEGETNKSDLAEQIQWINLKQGRPAVLMYGAKCSGNADPLFKKVGKKASVVLNRY